MGVEYRRRKNNKKERKKEEGRKTRQMTCGFHTLPNRNPLDFSVREGIYKTQAGRLKRTPIGGPGKKKKLAPKAFCV